MRKLLQPIIYNFPLFIVSFLLFGGLDVIYHQHLFHENETGAILTAYGEITLSAYLVCLCSYWLRKVHLKVFFYILLLMVYIVNFYLRNAFTTDISPKIVLLLFETNTKEVSGFFKTYFMTPAMYKTLIMLAVLLMMIGVGEYFRNRLQRWLDKSIARWGLMAVVLFGIFVGASAFPRYFRLAQSTDSFKAERWLMDIPFRKRMPMPNLCYSLNAIRLSSADLEHMISATQNSLPDVICTDKDSLNIVVVIGESFNKHHASLYGYYLDTTPNQVAEAKQGNLLAFNQVKAPHNMTSIVMKNVLCCNDVHKEEKWFDAPYFPAIFKKAGYKVWFWDNQYKWDDNAAWAFTLNSVLFNEEIQQLSYTAINPQGFDYDDGLISDFGRKRPEELGSKNLIIYHLGGQHFLAKNQYPQEQKYEVFTAKDVKDTASYLDATSRQRIAEYANATHFNDQVMRQVIDQVRHTNAVIIYFPDHGEEIFDYRYFYGRQLLGEDKITDGLIRNQIDIPFTVWCSDKWKEKHPDTWALMQQAIDKPFSTDIICHPLFHIGGIKTKLYQPANDLFSPDYKPHTKAINMMAL